MSQHKPVIAKGVDWTMIWLYIAICLIGLVCIISVEYKGTENFVQGLFAFKKNCKGCLPLKKIIANSFFI